MGLKTSKIIFFLMLFISFGSFNVVEAFNSSDSNYIKNSTDNLLSKEGGSKESGLKKSGDKKSGDKKSGAKKKTIDITNNVKSNNQLMKKAAKERYEAWKANKKRNK